MGFDSFNRGTTLGTAIKSYIEEQKLHETLMDYAIDIRDSQFLFSFTGSKEINDTYWVCILGNLNFILENNLENKTIEEIKVLYALQKEDKC